MIKAVLIACFVAVALAAPAPEDILNYDAEDHKHSQTGEAGNAVKGSYSYTDADGKTYTVNYVADENGYRATGDHLPVAPEVPAVAPEVPAVETKVAAAPAVAVPTFYSTLPVLGGALPYGYHHPIPYGYSYGYPVFPYYG